MNNPTFGQRLADFVADAVGSWAFIFHQSLLMAIWIGFNLMGWFTFDPYPFILLNLFLSFQAAYTAPFILMSQGRQSARDRETIEQDLQIDLKIEARMKILEEKLDAILNRGHS